MITRKALIAKLQSMDLDTVLFAGFRRSPNYRGDAAEKALRQVIDIEIFNQREHITARGMAKANPIWFKQLYTDLSWANGDITPGSILQALS